jgi:hypothetical protein
MTWEIPYLVGASRLVYEPQPSGAKERWFINDHCFITDASGTLHFFGINDPYPPEGKTLYRFHPYIGHATSVQSMGTWQRQDFALDDRRGSEYLGAPFVVWLEKRREYLMLFESMIEGRRELEIAHSADLSHWHRTGAPVLGHLAETKRDPCIVRQADGGFLVYLCTPNPEGSSVTVTRTADFERFEEPRTCLLIKDGATYGGAESPFVTRRNGLHYMFFTYAHRHYYETIVCVSESADRFSMENVVTTLYGHAAEIFEYSGKTYISSCGPEDDQQLNIHGLTLAELAWAGI